MDQANLERRLTSYFQTETDGAKLEPPAEWWGNLSRSCETASQVNGLAAAGERIGAWWKRPVIKMRSAMVAVPVMVVMILLAVLQPWTPGGGTTTVLAMEQLILKVNTTSTFDSIQSCRVIVCDSATIDANGNINYFTDTYNFKFVFLNIHLQIKSPQEQISSEFIHIGSAIGSTDYYRENNASTMNWGDMMNKSAGIPTKSKTLAFLNHLTAVQPLPDQNIDGVDCLHYKGIAHGYFYAGNEVPVDLWIGKADYIIRQLAQTLPDQAGSDKKRVSKYFDLNNSISIQAPIDLSGNLLTGWQKTGYTASVVSIPVKYIVENDTIENPYYAKVTFPTSWLSNSPLESEWGRIWIHSFNYAPGFSFANNRLPSDESIQRILDKYVFVDPDNGKTAVMPAYFGIDIGEQESTVFYFFTDPLGSIP